MAKITPQSVLGDLHGRIGAIIVTNWKIIGIVKSLPSKRKGKLSIKQLRQIELFEIVTGFLNKVHNTGNVIEDGYQVPKKVSKTAMNLATSYNMLNAFNDDGTNYTIDFPKVKFSDPIRSTENGWNAQFFRNEEGMLGVRWELNLFPEKNTNLDDQAVMIFFNSTQNMFLSLQRASRSSLGNSFNSDSSDTGDEIFCWLFFISADGKLVSETEYLGMITITAQYSQDEGS